MYGCIQNNSLVDEQLAHLDQVQGLIKKFDHGHPFSGIYPQVKNYM